MRVGIIQSCYIPWRGHFDFIDDVDLFIILDDIQYSSGTWRNRNRIKTNKGLKWLTVPIIHERLSKLINETRIDYSQKWRKTHSSLLMYYYNKAQHLHDYYDEFHSLIQTEYSNISELNVVTMRWMMKKLNIETQTIMSDELNASGTKTDRLINLLKAVNASIYLSGPSAQGYLDLDKFKQASIGLEYKTYDYLPYPQLWRDFRGQVTVLDLLFNCGVNSRNHLKSHTKNIKVL